MKVLRIIAAAFGLTILLFAGLFVVAGIMVPADASFVNEIEINAPAERVWQVINDKAKYTEWQTKLSRVEVTDGEHWREYPKDSPQPLEFSQVYDGRPANMEFHYTMGDAFTGHWAGDITPTATGVKLKTTDSYKADGWMMKILIWIFFDYDKFAKDWNNQLKARVETLSK